jgi:DNA-damage-inducible protein J
MAKTALITARIDPELKRETEEVLDEIGLTTSQAITLFFRQISLRKGLPFAVAMPNSETARAIENALAGRELHTAKGVDELFDALER